MDKKRSKKAWPDLHAKAKHQDEAEDRQED